MIANVALGTLISPTPKASNMLGQGNALDSRTAISPFSPVKGDTDTRTTLDIPRTSRVVPPLQGFDMSAARKPRTLSWADMFNAFGVFILRRDGDLPVLE